MKAGDHTVILYKNQKELIAPLVSFIKESLKRNKKCLYIKGDEDSEIIITELAKKIGSLSTFIDSTQLLILNKDDIYSSNGVFKAGNIINLIKEKADAAVAEGYKGLSITGELSWVMKAKKGKKEIIEYEWKLNEQIFNDYPVVALCRYNLNKFDNEVIKAVIELHHYLIWNNKLHENPYYIPPEGYKNNKVVEYEIKTWLKNIQEYEKKENTFKRKIEEKEEQYEKLFQLAPIGIVQTNSGGDIIRINKTMAEMMGFKRSTTAVDYYKDLKTDFYVDQNKRREMLRKLKKQKQIKDFQFRAFKATGDIIHLSMNAKITKGSQKGIFLIEGYIFDITEQKKAEDNLRDSKEKLSVANEHLAAYNEEVLAMNEELDSSFREVNELNQKFKTMISIFAEGFDEDNLSEEEFMQRILQTAVRLIPEADYGSIYRYVDSKVNFVDTYGYDLEKLQQINIPAAAFYNRENFIEVIDIAELKKRNKLYMEQSDFKRLEKDTYKMKKVMYFDLEINGIKKIGLSLDIADRKDNRAGNFSDNSQKIFKAIYELASAFYKNREFNRLQSDFIKELVNSIVKLLEMYDPYTSGHSENVAEISSKIAEKMGLSAQKVNDCYWAGLVHDVGKLLIPLEILNKKSSLSKSEYNVIKKHPVTGANSLKNSDSLKKIAKYVLHHHERWDGRGYPDGLEKSEIPTVSQIITVADAWDAMTSKRSYREPFSREKALFEIRENKGSQFSPKVVSVFLEIINSKLVEDKDKNRTKLTTH